MGKIWNRKHIVVDNVFAHNVALEIIKQDGDLQPKSIKECRQRNYWPKWKDTIQVELTSLRKCEVFEPIVKHLRV